MKKILSLLLAVIMVASLFPVTVFATKTNYAITNGTPEIDSAKNHGYISINKETAAENEPVTVTVVPNEGYQLKSLTVTPAATFKAVYDTTGEANTLTFYYDTVDHSGEGITVYDNLPTAATSKDAWGYDSIRSSVKSVKIDSSVADYKGLTSTAYMFMKMTIATSISGAEYLDVSNVTDMSYMFQNFGGGKSGSPTTLNVVPDVSKWNTGNVTTMTAMFESYGNFSSSLDKVPDVSGWNTGKVTDMTYMFQKYGHESQNFNAVPDVSKWNTANVASMKQMFFEYGHKSTALNTVPAVSNWNTGKATNMQQMFYEYGNASTNISCVLDLSEWDLSKITGTNGVNVFKFNPKTFDVTIPAKTGEKSNEGDKWYCGDETNFITPPEDKTFTPTAPTEYTVTFNLNGITGTAPETQKVAKDGKVTKPTDPTDSVHTFEGWYKTKDATTGALSNPWNFDNDTVTADMTLYAKWTTEISKIVGTNTGIPTVDNFDWFNPASASIPENAWVTDDENKAFWVPGDNGGFAILHTTETEDQTIIQAFALDDTDTFIKVGDTYVLSTAQLTATCTMTGGKFTSLTFAGINLSMLGVEDSSIFDGTYTAPAAPTFDENPFEPGNIKAGQTLTIKGKNLDLVTKVIFCNDVEVTTFKSQSSEQIVIENFPAKARTGKVTLVNGTTPQKVSDTDLVVAQPRVSEIYQFTEVRPNQKLTIEGDNFDLVYNAIIGEIIGDDTLDFIVSNEGHVIEITMPAEVHDDIVKVIAYSGVEVTVANVEAATPANKLLKSSAPKQLKSSAPAAPETITPEKQDDGTYQFTMPGYAVTVTAEFELIEEEPVRKNNNSTTITIGGNKKETKAEEVKEEENPDTGAPVMSFGAIAVVLGAAYVLSKKH